MESIPTVRNSAASGVHDFDGFRVEWSAVSDVGLVREANEDAALVARQRYLLADGMGGHDRGEIASEAVLAALGAVVPGDLTSTRAAVLDALDVAADEIDHIDSRNGRRAGTTVTGAMVVTYDGVPHWLVVNIGDSRTYRWSESELEQVTTDHSQVQELVEAGFLTAEQARVDPRRNVITRAVGAGMDAEADFFAFPVVVGDKVLICSDGLTGELPDSEISDILADAPDAAAAASELIAGALALGARDNVTVIVAAVSRLDDV
ncbi:serine/threonine-protein phosphatase [Williamsia sp. CHRR-6]|nr:serine/threonine-protein phosphatase [Williamsia sp. CHRR-6]